MARAILIAALGLLLAGCWQSEGRLFGEGDWAKLDLSGEYEVASITSSDTPRRAIITSKPDGLVEIAIGDPLDRDESPTLLGLVPIEGGSGFIVVDRTTAGNSDQYYLAGTSDDGDLGFYFPVCEATPAIEGLVVTGNGNTCTFTSKEALMKAALEAERFISTPHIVAVTPFLRFSKVDEDGEDEAAP